MLELDLKDWQEKWSAIAQEEDRIETSEKLTVAQRIKDFLMLCNTASVLLKETDAIHCSERTEELLALANRLRRLDEWRDQSHGASKQSFSPCRGNSATA
jgi:hypothetical protein